MNTKVFKIDCDSMDADAIEQSAKIIKNGGLVAFPTETVYGLGADATDKAAAAKIYAAKGRPSDNPLIIHISRAEEAEAYAYTSPLYYSLARAFMPGPLTIILPKRDTIPNEVTGGLDSVAVRCPSHPVARALIAAAGVPIAAPSANISGSPSPTSASHVINDMQGKIDAIIDGGECEIGLESTIVKLVGEKAILLRPGAITADALGCVCNEVEISSAVTHALSENERPLSPGMKYRHYAPSSPLVLIEGTEVSTQRFLRNAAKAENCVILAYTEEIPLLKGAKLIDIGSRNDLLTQAQRLFSALREADTKNADIIYAHLPPLEGMGLALYNRMIRAAAHTVKKV